MGILIQVVGTVILCVSAMNVGFTLVWPSSTLLLFKSENTTLHRPMTDMDASLFTSLPVIGMFVAQPLMLVCFINKIGLKYTTILTSMLFVVAWSVTALSNRVEAILLATVIMGAGNTVIVLASMYVSEIAQDSIRGTLTSGTNISLSLGTLVSYLLGGILEYHAMVYTYLSLAVISVVLVFVLKESPVQLMLKGKEEEAVQSLVFYRQTSSTSKELLTEISNIRRSLQVEFTDANQYLMQADKQVIPVNGTSKLTCWQLFKNTASIRRQFYLVLVLQTSVFYLGMPCIQIFAEPIFSTTVGDDISANLCTVILGIVILVGSILAAILTDLVGRRPLQIHSTMVGGVCCLFLGAQLTTEWFPKWTIPLVIYLFAIFFSMGPANLSGVVTSEIFLPEVKSKLIMLASQWSYICTFSAIFIFSVVIQSIGLAPAFYFCSLFSLITTVYYYFFLPETKGLPVYAIQVLFTKETD